MKPSLPLKLLSLSVMAALGSQPVIAEENTEEDEAISEIILVSTKRPTTIQETPTAVTAIGGAKMAELGIQSSIDLPKLSPGLKVSWQGPFPSFKMRGGGVAGLNGAAVPLYTNGLAGGTSWAGWLDVDRVEVMRGPQGTLYGANTLGGLVNLVYKQPELEEFDFGGAVTVGDFSLRRFEGFVNVPLGENVALRLTGSSTDQDPLIENNVNPDAGLRDEDNTYVRAQVFWEVNDDMTVNFEYTKWDNDSMGNANFGYHYVGIPVNQATGRASGFTDFIDPRKGTTGVTWAGGRTYHDPDSATDPEAYFELFGGFESVWVAETETFSFELMWDVGFGDLLVRGRHTDSFGYNLWDVDQGTANSVFDGNYNESKGDQIDVILNSYSDGDFRWGLGFYWSDYWDPEDNNGTYIWGYSAERLSDATFPAWTYWDVGGSKSKAVYANAEYDLTEDLTLSAGIRRQEDSGYAQRFFSNFYGDQSIWGSGYTTSGNPLLDLSYYTEDFGNERVELNGEGNTDYKVAFNWAFNDDINFYGSVSTGYIPSSVSRSGVIDPNELDAYELGMKSSLFDDELKLNIALYRSDYSGLSYTVFEQQGPTILSRQETGGSLSSQGIEFEALWEPIDGLNITAGLVLDDTTLDEYALSESRFFEGPFNEEGGYYPVRIGNAWFADGDQTRPVPTPTYILDGKEASFSPSYIFNLDISYIVELGDNGALIPGATVYSQADYKTMNEEFTFARQDGYTTVDFRVTWETPIDDLTVRAYVNNAFDELYKVSQNVFSNGRIMADYGRQRHWGVRVGYNF